MPGPKTHAGSRRGALIALLFFLWASPVVARTYSYLDSGGVEIAYTDYGSGVPVIFLHGLRTNYGKSLVVAGDFLSDRFRIIGVDQRGRGLSGKPHDIAAYGKNFVTDILGLMDKLGLPRAHIVGHSMGGIVALNLAVHHPDRVYSVTSIGNGLFTEGELSLIGWLITAQYRVQEPLYSLFGIEAKQPAMMEVVDKKAIIASARSLAALALSEDEARSLSVPVFAVRGGPEDDPRDTVERLAGVNPAAVSMRLEEEDHMSLIYSEIFLENLRAFLLGQDVR